MIKFFSQTGKYLSGDKFHVNIYQFKGKKGYCASVLEPIKDGKWAPSYSQRIYNDTRGWADILIAKIKNNSNEKDLIENMTKFFNEIV